jgi:peptidoglycan hydrolase-like protein with peptidoglycan-binding domain
MPQYMRGGYTKYQDGGFSWSEWSGKEGKKKLQRMLIAKKYLPEGSDDGILGKKTGAAVRQFQKDNGLAPDGILGPKTIKALQGSAGDSSKMTPKGVPSGKSKTQSKGSKEYTPDELKNIKSFIDKAAINSNRMFPETQVNPTRDNTLVRSNNILRPWEVDDKVGAVSARRASQQSAPLSQVEPESQLSPTRDNTYVEPNNFLQPWMGSTGPDIITPKQKARTGVRRGLNDNYSKNRADIQRSRTKDQAVDATRRVNTNMAQMRPAERNYVNKAEEMVNKQMKSKGLTPKDNPKMYKALLDELLSYTTQMMKGGDLGSPSYSAFSNYGGSHKNPMAGAMSYSDRAANYNASSIHGAYPNVSGIGYPMRMGGGYMPNNYMFGGYAGYPSNPGYANYAAYRRMQMGGGMPAPGGMPQGQPNPSSQRLQQMTGMEPMPPQGQPGPEGAPMGSEGAPQQAPQIDPQQLQQIAQAVAQGDERALQMLKQLPREVQQQVLQMVQQMKAQGQQEAAQMMYGGQMKKKKKKKKSLKRTGSMTHEKMLKQIMGK